MSFSVSSAFAPFAMSVAAQSRKGAAEREHAHGDAKRRQHRHPYAKAPSSAELDDLTPDPHSPLPPGTLIDVKG